MYDLWYDHITMSKERVTITLPEEVVQIIDRNESNRSKFILQAIQNELERRRQEELRRSLRNPHPESRETAELGLADWAGQLADGGEELLDLSAGKDVRWKAGEGWVEGDE